jgi:DNA-binding beta-propeller fold protein YncE
MLAAALVTACNAPPAGSGSVGSSARPARGYGAVSRVLPVCTTATQPAPALAASDITMTALPPGSLPFGVSVTTDGRWAFVALGNAIGVYRISASGASLARTIPSSMFGGLGTVLGPQDRYLLTADRSGGTAVLSVRAAERGGPAALLGVLRAPARTGGGAAEVAVTPDGRYAFVSLETAGEVAVFNLRRALSGGHSTGYVGAIPAQVAPVGLAISPDGRWLYSTSEAERPATNVGSLSVISVAKAETDPAASVRARVAAGCNPVRVITSANGHVVWVTARGSDVVLAFSAPALRADPSHALLADVRVGESPVGLALVRRGTVVVAADSSRFAAAGTHGSLAVVDVADALAGRPALLGYLAAGQFPREMAAVPGGRILLVTNAGSGQLEIVHLADLP